MNNRSNISQKMKNMANQMNTKGIDFGKMAHLGLIIIIVIIIIYILISAYSYWTTECVEGEKRPFWEYLIDLSERKICVAVVNTDATKNFQLGDIQTPLEKEEVFHISNQDYTYDQAKCKCESYGAQLATKEQVTDAYNKGASWCTYGWTNGQYAYYPVQQCDWDKIEDENKHKPHAMRQHCGKPGMNGGYFSNPYIKFGVNCYGKKPKGEAVTAKKPYCPPMNFCKLEQNFGASHKLDTDVISPFAPDKWNQN
jgi:hypothetical protein